MSPMDRALDLASQGCDVEQIKAALLEECVEAIDAAEQYIHARDARETCRERNAEWDR